MFISHFSQTFFSMNWQDVRGRSPLHSAVMRGDTSTVDIILKSIHPADLDLNTLDNESYTALGLAFREDQQKIVHMILGQTTHELNVSIGGGQFSSLMHLAVAK
jgi:ankyrin repeat protein